MKLDYLTIHQGALGDLILTLTAVNRALPGKSLGVFCRSEFLPLLAHLNISKHLHSVDDRYFSQLFEDIPSSRFCGIFDQFRHILLFSNSSVLLKNIESLTDAKVHQIPPRPAPEQRIHVVDFLVGRIDGLFSLNRSVPHGKCPITAPERSCIHGPILIHPGSGSPRKNWPLDNFVRIYKKLLKNNISTAWMAGPAEKETVEALKKLGITEKEICFTDDPVRLCRRLRSTGLFIGNDSGMSHLAAFLGTPVMTIFGPSDPIRWRPVGPDVSIVAPDATCNPCFEIQKQACDQPACFRGVSVEKVIKLVKRRCRI